MLPGSAVLVEVLVEVVLTTTPRARTLSSSVLQGVSDGRVQVTRQRHKAAAAQRAGSGDCVLPAVCLGAAIMMVMTTAAPITAHSTVRSINCN